MARSTPLPKHWQRSVQAALLQVMALAHYSLVVTRSWAVNSANQRLRLAARAEQLDEEVRLLREEIRIKDARMARILPAQRPRYQPTERLAILELRAARHWSLAQTADVFLVSKETIAAWHQRLDEAGPNALLQTGEPVNKFPSLVRYLVQRLHRLCPRLGKVKTAQILARAGLHLAASTVARMCQEPPESRPTPLPAAPAPPTASRVTANYPNHVWHVDLTVVPTSAGFWATWLPFALPQCWPFCWWLALVLDHHSRRALGYALFTAPPTSEQIRRFLGQVMAKVNAAPKYLITDSGSQFVCGAFQRWCRVHGIRQRRGAVGQRGSIAVIERFFGTLKREGTRLLSAVPLQRRPWQRELSWFLAWYN
jgi:transposase InsO family protein